MKNNLLLIPVAILLGACSANPNTSTPSTETNSTPSTGDVVLSDESTNTTQTLAKEGLSTFLASIGKNSTVNATVKERLLQFMMLTELLLMKMVPSSAELPLPPKE